MEVSRLPLASAVRPGHGQLSPALKARLGASDSSPTPVGPRSKLGILTGPKVLPGTCVYLTHCSQGVRKPSETTLALKCWRSSSPSWKPRKRQVSQENRGGGKGERPREKLRKRETVRGNKTGPVVAAERATWGTQRAGGQEGQLSLERWAAEAWSRGSGQPPAGLGRGILPVPSNTVSIIGGKCTFGVCPPPTCPGPRKAL